MSYAPIVLFVYNRLWHTQQTVEALKRNPGAANSMLFVFSDAPATPENDPLVAQVRNYLKAISGFASVTIVERERNYGLASNIIAGVTEITNHFDRVIVMEDDLLTSPFFLTYMNTALDIYETQEKVISIHGYTPPIKGTLPDTFFLRNADCWGWATWKRGWVIFEPDGKKLLNELHARRLVRRFDFDGTIGYTSMLLNQTLGRNQSWAVRWYASAFLREKLTLHPGRSLIRNIGADNSGTHRGDSHIMDVDIAETINLYEIPCSESEYAWQEMKIFYASLKLKFIKRCLNKLCQFLKL